MVVPAACGDALSAVVAENVSGGGVVTVYAMSLYPSYASTVLPALRLHTSTVYEFSVPGVHAKVALLDQSCTMVQLLPLETHHLYWYGATPFDALAVNVIVVPAACGDALSGVTVETVAAADT